MFFHPLFSLVLLLVPVAVYWFVIRPRLRAKLTEIYTGRGWLTWLASILYAFRTFVIASWGVLLAAAPDLLVAIAPVDFSEILPQPWGLWVGTGIAITIALMRAFETKPGEEKA